jgi:hypothetical protein
VLRLLEAGTVKSTVSITFAHHDQTNGVSPRWAKCLVSTLWLPRHIAFSVVIPSY